jgi:hypothetical protein
MWLWDLHIVCDQIDPGWEDELSLEIYGYTPSPDREFPSSATNSPPNSDQRFSKIEDKLAPIFEDPKNKEIDLLKVQKPLKRAIQGGRQALQDLPLAKSTIKRMQSHKIPVKKSPLSLIAGNSRVQQRLTKESRITSQLLEAYVIITLTTT